MKENQYKWGFNAVNRCFGISETGTKYRLMVLQWVSLYEGEEEEFNGNLHFESIDGKWEERIVQVTKTMFHFSESDLERMWSGENMIMIMEEIE